MDVVDVRQHRGEFFRVLQQTKRSQTAVMTTVGDDARRTGPGGLVMIPAGARHHVRNPGSRPLVFLTVYAPPEY